MFCKTCFSFLVSERLWESAGSSLKNNIWMLQNVWVFFCLGQSFQKTLSLEFHHKYVLHFSSMTPNKVHQELVRWIFIGWLVFKVTTRASGRCHISRSQRGRRGNCFETRKVNRWTNGSTVCERLAAHYQRCEWRRGRAWKWSCPDVLFDTSPFLNMNMTSPSAYCLSGIRSPADTVSAQKLQMSFFPLPLDCATSSYSGDAVLDSSSLHCLEEHRNCSQLQLFQYINYFSW